MKEPEIMVIDVEKALRSDSVWKLIKKEESDEDDPSCKAYRELTWDGLEDLEYNLRSVGIEPDSGVLSGISRDYTFIMYGRAGETLGCLISSLYEDVLWVNMLIGFSDYENCALRLTEKLAAELWLNDGLRPEKIMLLAADPGIEALVDKIFESGYTPERKELSEEMLPGADAYDRIRLDIMHKLTWKKNYRVSGS